MLIDENFLASLEVPKSDREVPFFARQRVGDAFNESVFVDSTATSSQQTEIDNEGRKYKWPQHILWGGKGGLNYERFDMSELEILFEDNHLIAVNKQPGLLVQGDETGDEPLSEKVKTYLAKKYQKPGAVFLGVVHRLDRPVSGVVVFARTSKALSRMNELFRHRETKKVYMAVVAGTPRPPSGTLIHWLSKDESKNKTTVYRKETEGAAKSELSYELLNTIAGRSLVEVRPVTGRSHQIRAQLSSLGCPIVGDLKYGSTEPTGDGSICLHALRLEFIHPVRKELLTIAAPMPQNHFWIPFG